MVRNMWNRQTAGAAALALIASTTPASAQSAPTPTPAPMLGDARPTEQPPAAKGGSVTLTEAVQRALARNPTAEIAHQEVVRSIALARQVRAAWFPTLNANATYTHLDSDRVSNNQVLLPQDSLGANLQLTVPLLAPKQWIASQRAKENIAETRSTAVSVRRDVAIATARAYLTVIAEHRVLQAAQEALTTSRAFEDYAVTRYQGGVGNRLDAVRASQERATADVKVKNELYNLVKAQEALGVLMGDENGGIDAAEEPSLSPPPSVDAAIGEASARRADIAVDRDKLEIARRAVRDSWVDYLPTLNAIAQPFYQDPKTTTLPTTGWQAQLVLQLPLYDGGLRYGVHDERKAVESEARVALEGALRQARSEVRTAFDELRRADEALNAAREALKLAKESLELAQLAYQAGATTNIEVVDAESRFNTANTAAAVAEDASRQARLDLLAACGRFP
jgi:outer membrane protein TolC